MEEDVHLSVIIFRYFSDEFTFGPAVSVCGSKMCVCVCVCERERFIVLINYSVSVNANEGTCQSV